MDRRPWHPPLLAFVAILALITMACIGGDAATPSAAITTPAPSAASPSASAPSVEPSLESPSTSPSPNESPSTTASLEPSEPPAASVADCAGTDDNRSFFGDAADAFNWPVYCPVLPDRWSVTQGTYRSAGIGWLQITYRGPGGDTLSLHQGAFCDDGDGCVAAGTESGDSPFGDQSGTLIALDDGGFALVVDRGQQPSWLAVGSGLDEAAFRDIAAELIRLD